MDTENTRSSRIAEIDYARDTLFGPIPMQATCRIRLATVEHEGQLLRELTIIGCAPDYLSRSAIVRVAMDGRIEAGPIRDHYALRVDGEEQFRLLFDNQQLRQMH